MSNNGIAETLCRHSQQLTETLLLVLRENVWPQCIADDIIRLAMEFQNLIDNFEERFHRFDQANELCYTCPNEVLSETKRGRSRLLNPKKQLEGLRSLGFSWLAIGKMLCVSERTIR